MKKNLLIFSLIVVFLSGCAEWGSINPLSAPAEPDKKLEGIWKFDSKDDDEVYLHIGKKKENTMTALSVEHKKDGSLDIAEIPFFITRGTKNNFFNVKYKDIDNDFTSEDDGYIFIKYSFKDENTLFLYQFDPEVIKSAVQSGKLKGEVYYREPKTIQPTEDSEKQKPTPEKVIESVKITETSENMIKFFESEGNKFISEVLKFVRVR